jgi:hypothetical protein
MLPLLFRLPRLMGPIKYAGIGARKTPEEVLQVMERAGRILGSRGYTLRSGHAAGADMAFERGALDVPRLLAAMEARGIPLPTQQRIMEEMPPLIRFGMGGGIEAKTGARTASKLQEGFRAPPTQGLEYGEYVKGGEGLLREMAPRKFIVGPRGERIALKEGVDPNLVTPGMRVEAEEIGQQVFKKQMGPPPSGADWANRGVFAGEVPSAEMVKTKAGKMVPKYPKRRPVTPDLSPASVTHTTQASAPPLGAAPAAAPELAGPMEIYLPHSSWAGGGPKLGRPGQYLATGHDPVALALLRGQLGPRFAHPNPALLRRGSGPVPAPATPQARSQVLEEIGLGQLPGSPMMPGLGPPAPGGIGPRFISNVPVWQRKPTVAEAFMARDYHQLLGRNLRRDDPVDFVMGWTPGGVVDPMYGGTSHTMRLAESMGIPVLNLGRSKRAIEAMDRPARIPDEDWGHMIEFLLGALP